jgi:hypothetical protein
LREKAMIVRARRLAEIRASEFRSSTENPRLEKIFRRILLEQARV